MLIRVKCIGQTSSQGVLTFPSIMPYLKVLVAGAILFCSLELQNHTKFSLQQMLVVEFGSNTDGCTVAICNNHRTL